MLSAPAAGDDRDGGDKQREQQDEDDRGQLQQVPQAGQRAALRLLAHRLLAACSVGVAQRQLSGP
jgi:hypothetical protein